MLVISKGLGKKIKQNIQQGEKRNDHHYVSRQAHTELATKMKGRDAASAPAVGDRVAFVMIKGSKG